MVDALINMIYGKIDECVYCHWLRPKVLQDLVRVRGCCHNLPKLFVLIAETSQMIIYVQDR